MVRMRRRFGRAGGLHSRSYRSWLRSMPPKCEPAAVGKDEIVPDDITEQTAEGDKWECCPLDGERTGIQLKRTSRPIDGNNLPYEGRRDGNTDGRVLSAETLNDGKVGVKIFRSELVEEDAHGEYRLMNLELLRKHVSDLTMHAATCTRAVERASNGESPIVLICEKVSRGLASVMLCQCQGCYRKFDIATSPWLETSSNHKRYEVNIRAVWGEMASGGGCSKLNESMSNLGAKGMTDATFSAIEAEIGEWWRKALVEDMKAASEEEVRLAKERRDFHEGIPATTVILDGGWSKRTHKHTYNALGGVVVVIGFYTKKLIDLEIRCKHCYICNLSRPESEIPKHECFQNWKESSQAMEADCALTAFSRCEAEYGLRYTRIVADGDSSVMATLLSRGPAWCRDIIKLECPNHACKCLRSHLEDLVKAHPQYKGAGGLTKAMRIRICSSVRGAISIRSRQEDKVAAANSLRHDILNSVRHCFGQHNFCSADFCKVAQGQKSTSDSVSQPSDEVGDDDDEMEERPGAGSCEFDSVIEQQISFWTEGFSKEELGEARGEGPTRRNDIPKDLLHDVLVHLNRLAEKATALIRNVTTNLAESWMSIRCKFDGGKMVQRCNRGSWYYRCYGAGLRRNLGPSWSSKVWSSVTGEEPPKSQLAYEKRVEISQSSSRKTKRDPEFRRRAYKRKLARQSESVSKKAKSSYGKEVADVVPDVSDEQLQSAVEVFFDEQVTVGADRIRAIEKATRNQDPGSTWGQERKIRLTSSNFGKICKLRATTPVEKTVQSLLYSSFKGNRYTIYGLAEERSTRHEYELQQAKENNNVHVEPAGLQICEDHNFLASSTDGIVVNTDGSPKGLFECKNVLKNKRLTLDEATAQVPNFCLRKNEQGQLQLKHTHDYYYQVQGQLHIFKKPWCDFIVRTLNPYQFHCERIYPDNKLWDEMVPKLKAFYLKALLPELASPRHGKYPGIREPGKWFEDSRQKSTGTKKQGSRKARRRGDESDTSGSETDADVTDSNTPNPSRFVGRRISHQWENDDGNKVWYKGCIVSWLDNDDFQIKYEGDPDLYDIDNLSRDIEDGTLKFL